MSECRRLVGKKVSWRDILETARSDNRRGYASLPYQSVRELCERRIIDRRVAEQNLRSCFKRAMADFNFRVVPPIIVAVYDRRDRI